MLEVSDIWFSYRRVPALRGISFDVRESEVVALVGPNGAGKSTTMKVVPACCRPTRAQFISTAGTSTANRPSRSRDSACRWFQRGGTCSPG